MSLMTILVSVAKRLEPIQYKFLWGVTKEKRKYKLQYSKNVFRGQLENLAVIQVYILKTNINKYIQEILLIPLKYKNYSCLLTSTRLNL